MSCPSATFAVWTSAWLHGAAAADDVLDAMRCWAQTHHFVADEGCAAALDLPTPTASPAPPAEMLAALRRAGVTGGTLALPVAGDVRGTGGKGPFGEAAVRAAEAVVFEGHGPRDNIGLVPRRGAPGDDVALRWTVYEAPEAAPAERTPLAEAEHELAGAMRAAATTLVELDVAKHRPNVRSEIEELTAATPRLPWPTGTPPRALRVLQRASEVAAILHVAAGDAPDGATGGALSASAMAARSGALQPLLHAVRFARCAAVNETVRVFADRADSH